MDSDGCVSVSGHSYSSIPHDWKADTEPYICIIAKPQSMGIWNSEKVHATCGMDESLQRSGSAVIVRQPHACAYIIALC